MIAAALMGGGDHPCLDWRETGGAWRGLRILYRSCHEVLEYDDLRLFTDRGHRVFSIGAFSDPAHPGTLRPALPQFHDHESWAEYAANGGRLTGEFLARFDLAIVNHHPHWAHELLALRPDLPVIYRGIGQSNRHYEAQLAPIADRIVIVRYSAREHALPGFLRSDAIIPFGKYAADFAPWIGGGPILTFHNSFIGRAASATPGPDSWQALVAGWPHELRGMGNESLGGSMAMPEEQAGLYRQAGLYVFVHTIPTSYTLSFMEALVHGVPILAPTAELVMRTVAPELLEGEGFTPGRYEIPDLLDEPALLYSSIAEGRERIAWLLANPAQCQAISARLRARFAALFDAGRIGAEWDALLRHTAQV